MENASKALIIAGAILLSILIIALGIYIFQQAKAAMNTDSLTSVEISTFNDPITQYAGDSVLGSSVSSLISDLVTNATQNEGAGDKLPTVLFYGVSSSYNRNTAINGGSTGNRINAIGGDNAAVNSKNYLNSLQKIRGKLAEKHNYYVDCSSRNAQGYVDKIIICY